jgi:hypothetical protein
MRHGRPLGSVANGPQKLPFLGGRFLLNTWGDLCPTCVSYTYMHGGLVDGEPPDLPFLYPARFTATRNCLNRGPQNILTPPSAQPLQSPSSARC